jgi:fucose permease
MRFKKASIFKADGCVSINSSKANPSLQADLFGDWREEVVYPITDGNALRVYTTTEKTNYKIGEEFDKNSLSVKMLYEDNTEKEVCGYEISGFDNMKVEPQTVTVTYKVHDNLCYNYKKLRGESMKVNYNSTIRSCFIGYIVQAIVNNFVPLLFITFQSQYSIPLSKITLLITINFGLQLIIDFASTFFIDKIGYRLSVLIAHLFAALGLISIAILPDMMNDSFMGIFISVLLYAVGGGLLEVVVSPIVEACPNEHKDKTMSMLHSFYCWGTAGVVVISTIFFNVFGIDNWKILALVWAAVPVINGLTFLKVPIAPLINEEENGLSLKELIKQKAFWGFLLIMCCAGASEQSVSQWASAFVEKALGISKSIGDLVGPTVFSVLMGISRAIYGKFGEKINLYKMMVFSGCLCVLSYLTVSFSSSAIVGLIGIAVSGFSVGILWPGTYSDASTSIKGGGTAMFAFLALAGDVGCAGGPTFAGKIAGMLGDNLKMGILAATVFPITLIITLIIMNLHKKSLYNTKYL